jgi:molybdopterin-guanine dinucleotide biosynthesis protein A
MTPPLFGLVLSGGLSTRMGKDKGSLVYHSLDQRSHCSQLLKPFCDDVFVSIRKEQESLLSSELKPIFDSSAGIGPAAGILAAHLRFPEVAWLILACDMPGITLQTVEHLVRHRDFFRAATCYFLSGVEPLFAIWEHKALTHLRDEVLQGRTSPRRALENLDCELVPGDAWVLENVNLSSE